MAALCAGLPVMNIWCNEVFSFHCQRYIITPWAIKACNYLVTNNIKNIKILAYLTQYHYFALLLTQLAK